MRVFKKMLLITSIVMIPIQALTAEQCIENRKKFDSLDRVYQSGDFRVYYSNNSESPDYLINRKDLNQNHVPDIVEDIAIQAVSTIDALTHLGFIHPLKSQRYINKAKFIDIHLIHMKGNGSAGENAIRYVNQKNKDNICSLTIAIRNSIDFPGHYWTIVNHELFHLYQYGYTQFKGGWFLEGMTNSMERLFKKGSQGGLTKGMTLLPATQLELEKNVYNVAYNEMWARLALLSDKSDGNLNLPLSLLNRKYINGTKVFKDEQLKGYIFYRSVLEKMSKTSNNLSYEREWDPYHWQETDQISIANRSYMLQAIQETMIEFEMNQTQEQLQFLKLR